MDLFVYDRVANGESLLDRVNGIFNGPSEFQRSSPPLDVVEDQDGYRFSFELPGLKSDSLEVKVEDETQIGRAHV